MAHEHAGLTSRGVVKAPRQDRADGARTQNSWRSGVARHVHGTSPWPEVDVGGAEGAQPGHLRLLIVTGVRQQVKMDAVRHGLHAGRADELEVRADTLGGAQHRLIVSHLVQGPVHRLVPEPGHGPRIRAVDHHPGDRPGVPVDLPRLQHAELVALRVGEDRDREGGVVGTRSFGGVRGGPRRGRRFAPEPVRVGPRGSGSSRIRQLARGPGRYPGPRRLR